VELKAKAGKPTIEFTAPGVSDELYAQVKASHGEALSAATSVEDKLDRQNETEAVKAVIVEQYAGDPEAEGYREQLAEAQRAADKLEKTLIRERIAVPEDPPRRSRSDEIRPIDVEVSVTPRTHGSALFTRGQTQALSSVALGTTREESAWTRSVSRPPSGISTTTTSHPSASARPAVWVGPSAATSARGAR